MGGPTFGETSEGLQGAVWQTERCNDPQGEAKGGEGDGEMGEDWGY